MARIHSFTKSRQSLRRHPTEVELQVGVIGSGPERLLHLSTFGSDDRVSPPKSSQSIQLTVDDALRLIEVLARFARTENGADPLS